MTELKIINPMAHFAKVKDLLMQLNPNKQATYIEETLKKMVMLDNYTCFGLYQAGELLGISSGWTTVRIYCGKHLELDNVIVDNRLQSKGLGKQFFSKIEDWALQNGYDAVGLTTYLSNARSHKFYFNQGYNILGFHFQKTN
ncbi:GNAT family N-acetyltransferase [uncultured Microscilla sp.]|uniref:GNAT family N-acetyltransferase n=1 Tax=uncultured Microscilla sp. TaxID=432653 RepID=UPI002607F924|nr:GNAT family N-acetyltransferase [uncultured Microscilla sp.]